MAAKLEHIDCPHCGSTDTTIEYKNTEGTKYTFHCKSCNVLYTDQSRHNPIGIRLANAKPNGPDTILDEPTDRDYITTTLSKSGEESIILKDQPMVSW